jgi:hypothetical protein
MAECEFHFLRLKIDLAVEYEIGQFPDKKLEQPSCIFQYPMIDWFSFHEGARTGTHRLLFQPCHW